MDTTVMGEELVKCICGKEIRVIMSHCGYINCPNCGMMLKVGSCD